MFREVARPAAVGLGRLAGDAEIADERLALRHLLIFQLQDFADPFQREGQPHVRAPYQGAAPGGRVKVWHSTDKYRRVIYQCNHKYKGGKPCSTPHVTEDQVKDAFVRAVNILLSEKEELSVNVQMVIAMLCDSAELEKRQTELKEELEVVVGLVERCVTENARVALDQDEYTQRYNGLVSRYEAVKAQFDEVTQAVADKADRKKLLEQFLHTVEGQAPVTEFDERLWSSLVDFVTVYSEKGIRVTFKDGTEIQV